MLVVISPAKKLDFSNLSGKLIEETEPKFKSEVKFLIEVMKTKSINDIKSLMSISQSLAELNHQRYKDFFDDRKNSKSALIAFKGDVYSKMDVDHYSKDDFTFAQKQLRILSGLYGVLKPLDKIQAYRLEMGITLHTKYGKDLYQFWQDKITDELNSVMKSNGDNELINLASKEYFSSINQKKLYGKVVNVVFKNYNRGEYRNIGLLAKRARGMMANFIIKNKLQHSLDLKKFSQGGYLFNKELSHDDHLIFLSKN